ncbi:MAG: lipopolysaccharide kinase InaA family protein [Candidatus Polarisedimenticolaceae bacterium]|nr:lipopolysaccharide kinase InaA family protein [Candidatus Polarisedimenticolaceae bacterium]
MDFINEGWQPILQQNGLDNFDALWNLDAEWFEEPNKERGGWSGVARIELKLPDGGMVGLFLKRQQNHMYKSPLHPIRGTLTFAREFKNIRHFQQIDVTTLDSIYFGQRRVNGNDQGILLTRELEGFSPIDAPQFLPGKGGLLASLPARKALFEKLAGLLRRLHAEKWQHGCLYPKHIFIKPLSQETFEVRLIDLEKARRQPFRQQAIIRDLNTFSRHTGNWSLTDRMRFFLIYRQEEHLSPESKKLWRAIAKKQITKNKQLNDNNST